MNQLTRIVIAIFFLLLSVLGISSTYQVHVTETAIITEFGKVKRIVTEPGLYLKVPFVQDVNRVEKRVLEWDGRPLAMTTKDKVFLQVNNFARWRVKDPQRYFLALRDERSAQSRLDDIIGGSTLNRVAGYNLIELIRTDGTRHTEQPTNPDEVNAVPISAILPISFGRRVVEEEILKEAQPSLDALGIELLDVRFKRLNYSEETQRKIYERMTSERAQIAERFRSEGGGEAATIGGERERELKRIQSEAYQKVQTIRGKADAEAANIYSTAFNSSPEAAEFYGFQKTLDTYEEIIAGDTTLVLSTDSDLYRLMKQLPPAPKPTGVQPAAPAPAPVAPAPAPAPVPATAAPAESGN
jgi:membrane protease subunit HflC